MKKILIVDDDTSNLEILKEILELDGYETLTTTLGLQAIELAIRHIPDIILLDIMLPDMSGIDVCAKIRTNPLLNDCAIIMITGLGNRDIRLKALKSGANEFLNKPLDPIEITTRIQNQLRIKAAKEKISSALDELNNINQYSESLLESIKLSIFDFPDTIEAFLTQIITSYSYQTGIPEIILVAGRQDDNQYMIYAFKIQDRRIIGKDFFEINDLGMRFADLNGKQIFYDQGHLDNQFDPSYLHPSLLKFCNPITNGIIYTRNELNLFTFNYQNLATAMEEYFIRGFLLHLNFYMTINRQIKKIQGFFIYSIGSLARAAEANDEDTGKHIVRVNEYSYLLAREMGMDTEFCKRIRIMAQLHDVGKIHIHPDILKKPTKLTPEEWELIRAHPLSGARIIGNSPDFAMARMIALQHHENWDGSGYPFGIGGTEISMAARIVKLVDIYDALRNERTYKPSFSHEKSIDIILNGDGRVVPAHFDPDLLQCFRENHTKINDLYEELKDA